MCAAWDMNGDGGSAGPREENYKAHSERRFIQPAGTMFAGEKLFSFCLSMRLLKRACQSLARRVITEQCLSIFILPLMCCCHKYSNLGFECAFATGF